MLVGCMQVGTAVVTRGKDHRLALGRLGALVEQLEALSRSGRQVILVTSGSVSVGRQKLRHQQILNSSPLEMTMEGRSSGCSESLCITPLALLMLHRSRQEQLLAPSGESRRPILHDLALSQGCVDIASWT